MSRPTMLGISDEVLTCDCCGKSNLKKTIVISLDGDSDPVYFGSTCAAYALKGRGIIVKGSDLIKQAEQIKSIEGQLNFYQHGLASMTGMIAKGHKRYLIAGKELGAELAPLCDNYRKDIELLLVKLKELKEI